MTLVLFRVRHALQIWILIRSQAAWQPTVIVWDRRKARVLLGGDDARKSTFLLGTYKSKSKHVGGPRGRVGDDNWNPSAYNFLNVKHSIKNHCILENFRNAL